MVIDNIELETEKMSLLPNKFYLIMTPSADGQAFDVTAYDTTDPKKPIPSAFFVLKGLMDAMRDNEDGQAQIRAVGEKYEKGSLEKLTAQLEKFVELRLQANPESRRGR